MDKRLKALQGKVVYIKLDSGAEIKAEVELYNSSAMIDTDYDSIDAKVLDVIKDQETTFKLASLESSNSLINITDNEITDIEIIGISQGLWRKDLRNQLFVLKSYLSEDSRDVALEGILHIDNERLKLHDMSIILPLNSSFDLTLKIKAVDCIDREGKVKMTVACDDAEEADFILALGIENEIVELSK
jgi:hypothetical protein